MFLGRPGNFGELEAVGGTGRGFAAGEREEEERLVRAAILALPDAQREVVLMHFAEGMSQKEIAMRLGVHSGTVGRQLTKALAALRGFTEGSVERSGRGMGVSRGAMAGAVAVVAGLGAMSMTGRAALAGVAAQGTGPGSAALTGGVAKSAIGHFGMGVGAMSLLKVGTVAAALVLAVGTAGYFLFPAGAAVKSPEPTALRAAGGGESLGRAVPASSPATRNSDEETLLQARDECFPPAVCTYLLQDVRALSKELDATGKVPVMMQANAVDHEGTVWCCVLSPAGPYLKLAVRMQDKGKKRLAMGNTDLTDIAAIISDTGVMLPIERERRKEGGPGEFRMSVSLDIPDPVMESLMNAENFCMIMRMNKVMAKRGGGYGMKVGNYPGVECIQQLALVAPHGWKVGSSTLRADSTTSVGEFTVQAWQKKVDAQSGLMVAVTLDRMKDATRP